MTRSSLLVATLTVVLAATGGATAYLARENFDLKVEVGTLRYRVDAAAKASPPVRSPTSAAVEVPGGRTVGHLTRQVMLDTLSTEIGVEKKLWIRVAPQDREAASFARQISDVFREVGWEVFVLDNHNLRFKPGLLMLIGAEKSPPSYVQTAQRALEVLSEPVTVGTGYVAYYEKMKRESPEWNGGVQFLPGQTYVVFVGRKPAPAAAG